ncbi:MAG: hypothetical protein AAGH64_11490, partial [Planctomycetota bacterium]
EEKGRRIRFTAPRNNVGEGIVGIITEDYGFDPDSPFLVEFDLRLKGDKRTGGEYEFLIGAIEDYDPVTGRIIDGVVLGLGVDSEGEFRGAFRFEDGVQTTLAEVNDDSANSIRETVQIVYDGFSFSAAPDDDFSEAIIAQTAFGGDTEAVRLFIGFSADGTSKRIRGNFASIDNYRVVTGDLVDLRLMAGDPGHTDLNGDSVVNELDLQALLSGVADPTDIDGDDVDLARLQAIVDEGGILFRGAGALPGEADYLDVNRDGFVTPGDLAFLFEVGENIQLPGGFLIAEEVGEGQRELRVLSILNELGVLPTSFERVRDWRRFINRYYKDEIEPWFSERRRGGDKRRDRKLLGGLF